MILTAIIIMMIPAAGRLAAPAVAAEAVAAKHWPELRCK